jgi:hypothetical protein
VDAVTEPQALRGPDLEPHMQERARAYLAGAAQAAGRAYRRKVGAVPMGAEHECWTNAWELATSRRDLEYAEGVALFADGTIHTHAWCVDRKGRVYDPTPGYAGVYEYQGFVIGKPIASRLSAPMRGDRWRSSLLECLAAARFVQGDELTRRMFAKLTRVDFAPKEQP